MCEKYRSNIRSMYYALGCIYTRAKAKVKATSLPICCIVSYLCVYTTAMSERQKIKENYHFRFRVRSNIKEPLQSKSMHIIF